MSKSAKTAGQQETRRKVALDKARKACNIAATGPLRLHPDVVSFDIARVGSSYAIKIEVRQPPPRGTIPVGIEGVKVVIEVVGNRSTQPERSDTDDSAPEV